MNLCREGRAHGAENLPHQVPDILLINGRIFTAVAERPFVEALAISGEWISATGTTESVSSLAGPTTKVIDLRGRLATPGFNDAHTHFSPEWTGRTLQFEGLEPTCEDVLKAVEEAAHDAPPGTTISGSIGATAFFDPRCTPAKLAEIAPEHPVMLRTWTPHAAILNHAMTQKLGVDEKEPPVLGGFFGKNMRVKRWDGVVHEYAALRLHREMHDLATEEARLREMLDRCVRWGITSIQMMSLPNDPQRIVHLLSAIDPPIRVRVIPMPLTSATGRLKPDYPAVPAVIADRVRVDGLKWLLDGTPIERSVALRKPYADEPGWSGVVIFPLAELSRILHEARNQGTQLMFHIAGDRATEALLQAMEQAGGPGTWFRRRVRIEHGDGIMPDLIPRARELGVVVVANPTHLTLGQLFLRRFGPDFMRGYQPIRSLLNAGVRLAIGSDGEMNPFLNIMFASMHPGRPSEAMTREEAIIAYTATSAHAEFEEERKGTLESGRMADIAVLSQDILKVPPQELPRTQSMLTIVGGKIVHNLLS